MLLSINPPFPTIKVQNEMSKFDSIVVNPSAQDIQDIRNGLIEHNAPYLKQLRRFDIAAFRYKENGEKRAGIVGEIWGNWLLIQYLWVDKNEKGYQCSMTMENFPVETQKFYMVKTL